MRERGFTLLEVLAAVAIIAITFTYLAAAGIDGIQLEGDSERRLRASLIADEALSDLETMTATGTAPPPGEETSVRDDIFTVRTLVEPYQAPVTALSADTPSPRRGARNDLPPSLIAFEGLPEESPLRLAQVEVSWSDGVRERSVYRSSFLIDRSLAQAILQEAGVPLEGRGAVAAEEKSEREEAAADAKDAADAGRNRR